MDSLPSTLYTAEQTRLLDQTAIREGTPGFTLMQRAGQSVFSELKRRWPEVKTITVLCGGGNNGGDGFVVAALAQEQGFDVQALYVGDVEFASKLHGEARDAWLYASGAGIHFQAFRSNNEILGDVIVDALLGTGLSGEVRDEFSIAINTINSHPSPVLSIDIPSGLCADSGKVLGSAVKADATVTFIGLKQGLFMYQAVDYTGEILFDGLLVEDSVYDQVPVSAFRLNRDDVSECLPKRDRASHKGHYGHLLVIGGDSGMGGAAIMAAEAAVRCGAGKVTLATRPEHINAALARCPEVMVKGIESGHDVKHLLEQVDAVVFGPGLGQKAWADHLLHAVWDADLPTVVDADGINMLVKKEKLEELNRAHWILTPHPGEASRLLNIRTDELQRSRMQKVQSLQSVTGGTVVLKGAGTLVSDGDVTYLCTAGNPGMASGGMGDVLSGITGALLAQGLSPVDAARVAVYAHSSAADFCAEREGEIGLKATDLIDCMRRILNGKS